MLIVGIIGHEDKSKTASLINSILSLTGKRVSVMDSKSFMNLGQLRIKSYIGELERNNIDIFILKIELTDVDQDFFKNFHLDVMIYIDKAEDLNEADAENYRNRMFRNFSFLNEKGIAIVNIDDQELLQFLQGMKYYIVTYGFNSKASITTSSTGDIVNKDNFMCCLQRTISARNGLLIEPQEYKINLETSGISPYSLLAAATFAIVNGVDLNALDYPGKN